MGDLGDGTTPEDFRLLQVGGQAGAKVGMDGWGACRCRAQPQHMQGSKATLCGVLRAARAPPLLWLQDPGAAVQCIVPNLDDIVNGVSCGAGRGAHASECLQASDSHAQPVHGMRASLVQFLGQRMRCAGKSKRCIGMPS